MTRVFALGFLVAACLFGRAKSDEPSPGAPATHQQVEESVGRAIGYLQTESAAWLNTRKCAACHHMPMPMWALSEAQRQGYAIDEKFVKDTAESTFGSVEKLMASKVIPNPADPPDPRPLAQGVNTGAVFVAVAAQSLPSLEEGQRQSLRLLLDEIVKKQRDDGSWDFFLSRPPINESQTTDTAWIVMALQGEGELAASESQRVALDKAMKWFSSISLPDNHQDKVFEALIGLRAGKSRAELQPTLDELLALQESDGGWRQNASMPTDAFATGQTLYVLALAGYEADRPEIQRAIHFLVATQQPDGSWPMTSRSSPDGKPGSAKLLTPITCGATSWAVLGMSKCVPKAP